MNWRTFTRYLERDGGRCYHCGISSDTLVPQHRAGRGMGGSRSRGSQPSNVITLCSAANGLLESDSEFAEVGRDYGWKISTWEDPTAAPVYSMAEGIWYLLDDQYGRTIHEPKISKKFLGMSIAF